jgi:microcystin-dependent protein
MTDPFIGELKLVGFNYAPRGWAFCNGQQLAIQTNQALFSLLGTQYGGNGQTTFALPDLRGRVPLHADTSPGGTFSIGQGGGEEAHTLLTTELPQHNHLLAGDATTAAASNSATPVAGNALGATIGKNKTSTFPANIYNTTGGATGTLAPATIGNSGGSQPHENRQPFTVMNWIIALNGIFPSRN